MEAEKIRSGDLLSGDLLRSKEISYTKSVPPQHIKSYGQYFTDHSAANFMCSWACKAAGSMLDPAVGNSIFLSCTKRVNPSCSLNGYEIDETILSFFGDPTGAGIKNEDYLLNGWDEKYDAIVCNPPYNRFQAVSNRSEILTAIYDHTGVRYSAYTNLYILFLIKSIYQMSENGRLAYIIPSEFLNSKYGIPIKRLLIEKKLLRAIINFENDSGLFYNATTTCCIILLDKEPKDCAEFYSVDSMNELEPDLLNGGQSNSVKVGFDKLRAEDKWRSYLKQETRSAYANLVQVSQFCCVSRGIATGANDFFCFSLSKASSFGIPEHCLTKCICRSADVKSPVFCEEDFNELSRADRTVYLLDVTTDDRDEIARYIEYGEENGIHKKYLPSSRKPWYSMEQRKAAPIWVTSACRENIKFIRNAAMIRSLTTFHQVYVRPEYEKDTDIIFCYFLTPVAQSIIRENRKELGNGLEKFQPNDLNTAGMLDIRLVTEQDRERIYQIYEALRKKAEPKLIGKLNEIFSEYL